ncbi:MAG: hypothetical protein RLZZ488_1168 [Pseudomonadota bacterium]|jgi:hypothetical protein
MNDKFSVFAVSVFIVAGCNSKTDDPNEADLQSGSAGAACSNPDKWTSSACGKDTSQVVIREAFGVFPKMDQATQARGFRLCAGRAEAFVNGRWESNVFGVWLNGFNLGCHKGVGYKISGSAQGANVVTIFKRGAFEGSANTQDSGFLKDIKTGKEVGSIERGGSGNDSRLVALCIESYASACSISANGGTLKYDAK